MYWGPNHYMIGPHSQKGNCLYVPPKIDEKTGDGEWPLTNRRDWCAMFYSNDNAVDMKQF
jgi:hypothetical protein